MVSKIVLSCTAIAKCLTISSSILFWCRNFPIFLIGDHGSPEYFEVVLAVNILGTGHRNHLKVPEHCLQQAMIFHPLQTNSKDDATLACRQI